MWLVLVTVAVLVGLAVYWLVVWTEGVYLGRRAVVWMYDITAYKYDDIKQFHPVDERRAIARPLLTALKGLDGPLLLDIATGTGRVPALLLNEPDFLGRVIGLDAAAKMLALAQEKLLLAAASRRHQATLIQQTADALPFTADSFDAVTCLEALEFFPSDRAALEEMARVLRPGGFLMISRRCGWEGRLFFGRYRAHAAVAASLAHLGFVGIQSHRWQANYNMVTAWKRTAP
jgi:ubiquinone/menaquinone biosynthesis C-methylase UbiE